MSGPMTSGTSTPFSGPGAGPATERPARQPLTVRLCARWWHLHTRPQPERTRGNIDRADWRPRTAALPVGLPLLAAVLSLAPPAAKWLTGAGWPAPVVRALVWLVCLAAVFEYVAKVTTGRRGRPLLGRHGGHRDAAVVSAAALALSAAVPLPATAGGSALAFALPLMAGAHFSYAEKLPRSVVRSLNPVSWHEARTADRCWMLLRALALAGAALGLTLRLLSSPPAGWWIAAGSLGLGLGLWHLTRVLRPAGYYPYVHHWFVFLWLAGLSAGSTPLAALAAGAFVEGAARWSCAPLWHLAPGTAGPVPVPDERGGAG